MSWILAVGGILGLGLAGVRALGLEDRASRALLAPGLGLGGWAALVVLLGALAPDLPGGEVASALGLLAGIASAASGWRAASAPPGWRAASAPLGWRAASAPPRGGGRAGGRDGEISWGMGAALLLLSLATWLYPVGRMHLDPGDRLLVVDLPLAAQVGARGAAASHPLGPGAEPTRQGVARILGALGGDPLQAAACLTGAAQVLAFLAWFALLRWVTSHALGAWLGAGAMFWGGGETWLVVASPAVALCHLWISLSLSLAGWIALSRRGLWGGAWILLLGGGLLGLGDEPSTGLAFKDDSGWNLLVVLSYTGLGTWAAWSWREAGSGGWGLARRGGRWILRLPRRLLPGVAVGLAVLYGFEPGETRLNREVLLAAQRQGLPLTSLWRPPGLAEWAAREPGLGPEWVASAREASGASGPFLFVPRVLGSRGLRAAGVWSALAGQPLEGMHADLDSPDLLPPAAALAAAPEGSALAAAPEGSALAAAPEGSALAALEGISLEPGVRRVDWPPRPSGAREPAAVPAPPGAALQGPVRVWPVDPWVPGRPTRLGLAPPAALEGSAGVGVLVSREGEPYGRPFFFPPGSLPALVPPRRPGRYTARLVTRTPDGAVALEGEGVAFEIAPPEAGWAAVEVGLTGLSGSLPSRTLLPLGLTLRNRGGSPLDLTRLPDLEILLVGRDLHPDERLGRRQPLLPRVEALLPGESVSWRPWLATPLTEGTFEVRLRLCGPDEEGVELLPGSPRRLQTRRRLPAGGAW